MNALISKSSNDFLSLQFPRPRFLFRFPSLYGERRQFLPSPFGKWLRCCKTSKIYSVGAPFASNSTNYGGWDDIGFVKNSAGSGESDQFRNFLVSFGIDERKHFFVFLLGIVCAFSVYRVRVSSIILFPASVLIFAIGFSIGLIRGGSIWELGVSGKKRTGKEESFSVDTEKLANLEKFFDEFDAEVVILKNGIQRAIKYREIKLDELENYVKTLETISLSASNARNNVKALIDNGGNSTAAIVENQKPNRRRKDLGEIGHDILQSLGGSLFGEQLIDSKYNKSKNNVKREIEDGISEKTERNGSTPTIDNINASSTISIGDVEQNIEVGLSQGSGKTTDMGNFSFTEKNIFPDDGKINLEEMHGGAGYSEEYSYQKNRLQFTSNQSIYSKMNLRKEKETLRIHDNLLNSVDYNVKMKHTETEASFLQEHILKKTDGIYKSSEKMKNSKNVSYGSECDHLSENDSEIASTSSSVIEDDALFNRYLTEANDLLKQAKDFMRRRQDEERAETILYRSAKILSKAIAMKPLSLLAVGQLGNTYLLHGELKLRISRDLRSLISVNDFSSVEKQDLVMKGRGDEISDRDKLASLLINVCEECEELLLEAGRKYRLAFSIDGNDVRALYNWGLALSFRAQLIADIGPEAAFDADKVFLAAIDKFDSMLTKGNDHAPDALFRWAVALQQRSRLRSSNSKNKAKLLQQAKRLYEDALSMDSGNLQVREALLSCISELKFAQYY